MGAGQFSPQPCRRLARLVLAAVGVLGALHATAGPTRAHDFGGEDDSLYVVADALFLQRNNACRNEAVIVSDQTPPQDVLTTRQMVSPVAPGTRIRLGSLGAGDCDSLGWEAGYLGVYGMNDARRFTDGGGTLQAGGGLGFAKASGLSRATSGFTTYDSTLNSAELSAVWHDFDGGFSRRSRYPWARTPGYAAGSIDYLLGPRWAQLDESALLGLVPQGAGIANTYGVNAVSNLYACQFGARGRMAFERWATEGWIKFGPAISSLSQSQSFYNQVTPGDPFRPAGSASHSGMGSITDMNLTAVRRIDDTWGLRVGYNLIWLTGVALAPDQWSFSGSRSAAAGDNLVGTGSIFLQGGSVGLEARW